MLRYSKFDLINKANKKTKFILKFIITVIIITFIIIIVIIIINYNKLTDDEIIDLCIKKK